MVRSLAPFLSRASVLSLVLVMAGCGSSSKTTEPPCLCGGACGAGGACDSCDASLALDSSDPAAAAAAIGICRNLVSAKWVLPDGSPPTGLSTFDVGHGLLSAFGPNVTPRAGSRLLALSTGTARAPTDVGYQSPSGFDKGYTCTPPIGFPKESTSCPGVATGQPHDGAALELKLTVPAGATGLAFDYKFYTFEWPDYICSTFNDVFVTLLSPTPPGLPDGNIAADLLGNPVSVNGVFIEACGCSGGPPCMAGGTSFSCPLGASDLVGTGFIDDMGVIHGATGWRTASGAVTAGSQVTLRFAIWDSGDGVLDSTVLLDNFRWTK